MDADRLPSAAALFLAGFSCAFFYDLIRRVFSLCTRKRSDKIFGGVFFVLAAACYVFSVKILKCEGGRLYLPLSFLSGAGVYAASLRKGLDFLCAKCYNLLCKFINKAKGK